MKKTILLTIICLVLASCGPIDFVNGHAQTISITYTAATVSPVPTAIATISATTQAASTLNTTTLTAWKGKIPNFDHIVFIALENHGYGDVIGSSQMPYLNSLAKQYVLLTQDYAVSHPSLPNYIAMFSGGTQHITKDCTNCFVDQTNLADLIEKSGRTWKSYQEDMPSACFIGDAPPYVQKHNPFIYFNSIRLNSTRCERSIVPLSQLDQDLAANKLPNFSFIMPNSCNSGHDCSLETVDQWINGMITKLQASTALGKNYLIIITFDESKDKDTSSCCGMGSSGGGQVATVLISPQAKPGFTDATPTSHYGLLKTILLAWNLPDLGYTQQANTQPIVGPWQ